MEAHAADWSEANRHAGGRLEKLHHPYRNAFSGRTTSRNHFHFDAKDELCWRITCWAHERPLEKQEVDVVQLVEWMINEGWEKIKK